ncbi:CpaD family pilus assembly protein [Maricaulaceae bacterium MS644]
MTTMKLFLCAIAALSLAACAGQAPRSLPQASAVPETVRVEMPVDGRDNGLTWDQLELIGALAGEYKARGHGPLVISYPRDAANSDAAIQAIAHARTQFYEAGLSWRQISGGAYNAQGLVNAPVIFSFTRYRAVTPACPEGWENLRNVRAGEPHARFGCATAANLAAMVADPRDLTTPRTFGDPDAARRQTVLDQYRRGEATATERGAGESGTVSTAVNN